MKLIIGLGNPGEKYKNNRHNVGHMIIDYIVDQVQSSKVKIQNYNSKFKTYKTDCFMNESGKFVKKVIENYKLKIENLIVVHDDLDIPLGKFKIQKSTGPLLHNGIESVENALGRKDFWRIRVGVDNRLQTGQMDGETYVLTDFRPQEKEIINQVFQIIFDRLKTNFSL